LRHRLPVRLAALAALVAATGGCREKSAPEVAQEAIAAIEGMDAIPASADVVLGAEVGPLSRSVLVERAVARMLDSDPGLRGELEGLFAGCGFDPVGDLTTVLVAMDNPPDSPPGSSDRALLVASGRLSEAKLASCVGQHMSKLGGQLVQKAVGGRVHYHADAPPGRTDVWFAFGSAKTVVASSSSEMLAESLGDGPRLAADSQMAELVHRARVGGASLWVAGRLPPEVGKGLVAATGGQVGAPRAIFGHLAAETGLTVVVGADMASPDEAKSAVSLANAQLRLLTQVAQRWRLGRAVAKITTEAEGSTAWLRLALTDEELRLALAPVDTDAGPEQNPAPTEEDQGDQHHGQGDAAPGGQAPLRKQGQAD
jgi:hypothetical protein